MSHQEIRAWLGRATGILVAMQRAANRNEFRRVDAQTIQVLVREQPFGESREAISDLMHLYLQLDSHDPLPEDQSALADMIDAALRQIRGIEIIGEELRDLSSERPQVGVADVEVQEVPEDAQDESSDLGWMADAKEVRTAAFSEDDPIDPPTDECAYVFPPETEDMQEEEPLDEEETVEEFDQELDAAFQDFDRSMAKERAAYRDELHAEWSAAQRQTMKKYRRRFVVLAVILLIFGFALRDLLDDTGVIRGTVSASPPTVEERKDFPCSSSGTVTVKGTHFLVEGASGTEKQCLDAAGHPIDRRCLFPKKRHLATTACPNIQPL